MTKDNNPEYLKELFAHFSRLYNGGISFFSAIFFGWLTFFSFCVTQADTIKRLANIPISLGFVNFNVSPMMIILIVASTIILMALYFWIYRILVLGRALRRIVDDLGLTNYMNHLPSLKMLQVISDEKARARTKKRLSVFIICSFQFIIHR